MISVIDIWISMMIILVEVATRGGRLTLLDASYMQCFVFFSNIFKNIEVDAFSQYIAETLHHEAKSAMF